MEKDVARFLFRVSCRAAYYIFLGLTRVGEHFSIETDVRLFYNEIQFSQILRNNNMSKIPVYSRRRFIVFIPFPGCTLQKKYDKTECNRLFVCVLFFSITSFQLI